MAVEKSKGRLDYLKEKVYAFSRLPDCAIREVLSRIGLLESESEEQEYSAQHEAGHTLLHLLEGQSIQRAEISRLRNTTSACLSSLLGDMIQPHGGAVVTNDKEDIEFAKQHPDRRVILFLAGLASQDPKYDQLFKRDVDEYLSAGADGTWKDISIPYVYIQDRFSAIHQRMPAQQEIVDIFYNLLSEIRTVFFESKFVRALFQIKELIKDHKLKKGNINDIILQTLFANGLSQEDLTEMQQRIFSIDIDRIIQKHGRMAA